MSRIACLSLFLIGAAPVTLPAHAAPPPVVPLGDSESARTFGALLDQAYPADGPGATVVVTRDGRTLFAGARGMADVQSGRKLAVDTPFPLASITKVMTATLVAKFAEEGKLSLDDKVAKYVPAMAAKAGGVTIRQLLNHNSGIADYSKVPGFIGANRDKRFTTAALVEVMATLEPTAAPGVKWEYNNGGYALLGAVIEKATGQPWHEAMRERLFTPLGLSSFTATALPASLAQPYGGPDAKAERLTPTVTWIAGAAGQMVGNAPDLARFFNALHGGKLVSDATYRQMMARAPMADGKTMPYGFGFRLGRLLDTPIAYQGGALRGGRTETLYLPEHKLFVAILANSDEPRSQPRELALRMAAAAIGAPLPMFSKQELAWDRVRPMLGRYKGSEGPDRQLFERDGKLWFAFGNSPAREAFAAGGDRYFFGHDELRWFELKPVAGKARLVMHAAEDRRPHDAVRVDDTARATPVDRTAAGRYQPEAGNEFVLAVADDGTMTVSSGGKTIGTLRATEGGRFAVDGTPMKLEFVREQDRVVGIRLFRGARTMNAKKVD